jgi:hypothetical protein
MTLNEAAVRWLQHHSALGPADHGIIYGGSKPDQVAATVRYKYVELECQRTGNHTHVTSS